MTMIERSPSGADKDDDVASELENDDDGVSKPENRSGLKPGKQAVRFPDASDRAARAVDLSNAYIVRSLNSTTNKALHLGHLRNVVLGAATAASIDALGGHILRHCVLEDTGRFMTEAMVGIRDFDRSGASTAGLPSKPDHFIGHCYRQYRQKNQVKGGTAVATTGYDARNDAADEFMRGLMRGDAAAQHLRDRVREMALDGQQATLRRIGVSFDHVDYESAEDAGIQDFLADGLARGVFLRNAAGEIVFVASSGRVVRLANNLGLAEESARLLSFLLRLFEGAAGNSVNVIIAGSEWKGSMSTYAEILFRLGVKQSLEIYAPVFYGMVTLDGKKMASSAGPGVLVDDLLDRLTTTERIRDLARRCDGHADIDGLAAMVTKCFFLSSPRTEAIDFAFDHFDDPAVNPGWSIASAWATQAQGAAPGQALSPASRSVLLESLAHVSFEDAIAHTLRIAERVLEGSEPGGDLGAMVSALSIVPRRNDFAFRGAGPLAVGRTAAPTAMA